MIRASSGISSPALLVRVALAVPALVTGADDRADVAELVDRREDLRAQLRVHLDQRALVVVERAGLQEDRVRDADLADVVEERAELEALERLTVEPELGADLERGVRDPARMRGRVLVARLERVRERLDRGEERALERLEARRVRDRELGLVGETAQELELALGEWDLRRRRRLRSAPAAVHMERGDRVGARPAGRRIREGGVLLRRDEVGLEPRRERRDRDSREAAAHDAAPTS